MALSSDDPNNACLIVQILGSNRQKQASRKLHFLEECFRLMNSLTGGNHAREVWGPDLSVQPGVSGALTSRPGAGFSTSQSPQALGKSVGLQILTSFPFAPEAQPQEPSPGVNSPGQRWGEWAAGGGCPGDTVAPPALGGTARLAGGGGDSRL